MKRMILFAAALLLVTGIGWNQKAVKQIKREKTEKVLSSKSGKNVKTRSKTNLKKQSDGVINGHDYVDLGLPSGTKWATCNIGSSSPEKFGNYYAWGETDAKDRYDGNNYQVDGHRSELKKARIIDEAGNLRISNDIASIVWGSPWRLPTKDEIMELKEMCKWTPTVRNGISGLLVTGPNGHTIFLPKAGWKEGKRLVNQGGTYWSATLFSTSSAQAFSLYIAADEAIVHDHYRADGCSIRPVSK